MAIIDIELVFNINVSVGKMCHMALLSRYILSHIASTLSTMIILYYAKAESCRIEICLNLFAFRPLNSVEQNTVIVTHVDNLRFALVIKLGNICFTPNLLSLCVIIVLKLCSLKSFIAIILGLSLS